MKEIELTRGYKAIIDNGDFDLVSKYKWRTYKRLKRGCKKEEIYAIAHGPRHNYKREEYKMHRLIIGAKKGEIVDHINGDGLDNRKCNLRICTSKENSRNQVGKLIHKYKGLSKQKSGSYRVIIVLERKIKELYLGVYKTAKEAAKVYDRAALYYFGDFAKINFPELIEDYKLNPYVPGEHKLR